jgi:hypothetical protein
MQTPIGNFKADRQANNQNMDRSSFEMNSRLEIMEIDADRRSKILNDSQDITPSVTWNAMLCYAETTLWAHEGMKYITR